MTTTVELLTPFGPVSDVVELSESGLYRKQILRFCTINYRGPDGSSRKIKFDRKYGEDLVRAFKEGAYDQVPFQLATPDNRHNNDPRNTGGELVGVELSKDGTGLDGVMRLWGEGQRAVENNRKLGVSARIIENLSHSDGRTFPRALQHVLGTVDPQVTQMHPWERVELSNGVSTQVDLSDQQYGRGDMPGTKTGAEETHVVELTTAQRDRLIDLLENDEALADLASKLPPGFLDDTDPEGDDPEGDDTEDEGDEDEPSGKGGEDGDSKTDLSKPDGDALELARAQLDSQEARIIELTRQAELARTEADLDKYRSKSLAPAVIEAARSLMTVPAGAVELSNGIGTKVDPGEAVRELLDTVIELASAGNLLVDTEEIGTLAGNEEPNAERKAMLDDWTNNYG